MDNKENCKMKLSSLLFSEAEPLWIKAADKKFLVEMADGTLDSAKYRNYMLQDYLYLRDYIEILKRILTLSNDSALNDFLNRITDGTKNELYRVHLPEMQKIGIEKSDIERFAKSQIVCDYINYFHETIDDGGVLFGLTALLQCSWNYAYVAQIVSKKYACELSKSVYKSWFDAYTCKEYSEANQLWIDVLDEYASGIDFEEADKLCRIFKKCACFENMFWDYLYEQ